MINDEEDLIVAIRDHVKNNLNSKISLINSEKADGYSIDSITADNNHYLIAGEMLELPNHIFCQVAFSGGEILTKNNFDDILSVPEILVEVAFDNPKKAGTYFKSLRYMRALYETMLEFESSAIEADDLQITKAVPMMITSIKRELVVSGVGVSLAIG